MKILIILMFSAFLFAACKEASDPGAQERETSTPENNLEIATFAGGCFWCVESDFEKLPGVRKVISGYTGGSEENPTYKQVSSGTTGHLEAVQIYYDPTLITYEQLLDHLWRHIDPTDAGGQFVDQGYQYRSAIFYHNDRQKKLAEASKEALNKSGTFSDPIVTEIVPFTVFYEAETYHQDYYKKNPLRYKYYRHGSGRDQFIEKVWKDQEAEQAKQENTTTTQGKNYMKPDDETLRKELTDLQYKVTQLDDTEPPFRNEYWDNKAEGIYVDIVSGEPLFASSDKFESGTGWPSYTKPLEPENIVEIDDFGLFVKRTEVRSKHGNSHLGHVFPDGPKPTGLRYCINSASLRFIPKEDLEKEGYEEYVKLFAQEKKGQ